MQIAAVIRTALRSVPDDASLSVVDHLDELRTRMIVALSVLAVAFALCFSQNQRLLDVVDAPLAHVTQNAVRAGDGPLGATYEVQEGARDIAVQLRSAIAALSPRTLPPSSRAALAHVGRHLSTDIRRLSTAPRADRPVTLGIGEPFTTTVTVTLIFALILSMPVILLQVYGFLMPAFEPEQRRRMRPVLIAVPGLFIAGVAFGYFIVLPAAVHFLQTFNADQFNVLVQAGPYYKFAATILLAMGLLFEIPVAIIALTRAGVVTPRQLRHNRRWAVAACAAVGALLPGDAITMLLETVPLYLLFELSLLIATVLERRDRRSVLGSHASA